MKKMLNKKNLITLAVAVGIYAVLMALSEADILSRHLKSLLVPAGINVILAVSLTLTVGFLGELTLGHAGFMSVGAYAGCILTNALSLPAIIELPLAMLLGGVLAAVAGIVIGIPALRLKGDYLAIVTLAFGEIVRSVFMNLDITGGAAGLKGIETTTDFTVVFVVIMITVIVVSNLVKSRHGRAICSIRDNIIASESLGINVVYYKLLAFVVAAFFAGVAGVLYGHNVGLLKPATFDFNKSIEILVIVVLGGMSSIRGAIISAVIITVLPEVLRGMQDYRMLVYAIVLIVMMLLNASPKFADFKVRMKSKFRRTRKEAA